MRKSMIAGFMAAGMVCMSMNSAVAVGLATKVGPAPAPQVVTAGAEPGSAGCSLGGLLSVFCFLGF